MKKFNNKYHAIILSSSYGEDEEYLINSAQQFFNYKNPISFLVRKTKNYKLVIL